MNLKDLIKTEIERKPARIVLYGPHGIGKSTFGASAPKPIFLQTEDGLTRIKAARFPKAESFLNVLEYINMLLEETHEYQTLVLDTADWTEKLIFDAVCEENGRVDSIEKAAGGYGKGFSIALNKWGILLDRLEELRASGMSTIVLAHCQIKSYNPPDSASYDRYQIKIHEKAAAKLEEWADAVLFANYKIFVDADKNKAVNTAPERIMYTTERPAWRAKNRYSLPETLPLDFAALLQEIKK